MQNVVGVAGLEVELHRLGRVLAGHGDLAELHIGAGDQRIGLERLLEELFRSVQVALLGGLDTLVEQCGRLLDRVGIGLDCLLLLGRQRGGQERQGDPNDDDAMHVQPPTESQRFHYTLSGPSRLHRIAAAVAGRPLSASAVPGGGSRRHAGGWVA